MRQGQHKHQHNNRQRGRNRGGRPGGNGGGNPINRVYESNGPDVKVRGTAQTIAEKYLQLARDAHSSGDIVMAESYYQHAEHYLRILAAAQAYNQIQGGQNQQQSGGGFRNRDDFDDDGEGNLDENEANGAADAAAGDEQPVIAEMPAAEPQNQGQHQAPRRQRNFDDRGERQPRGERPPRQFQPQPQPQPGDDEQPRVSEEAEDGWTGPQPSFLRRPAPAAGQPGDAAAPAPAVRARRQYRERAPREAVTEANASAETPSED